MKKIINLFFKNRIFFSLILVFLLFYSFFIISRFSVSLLPSYNEPVLTVVTEYNQMSPDLIERMITKPLEGIIKEFPGVKTFYSSSTKGKSKIVIYFEKGEDIDKKSVILKDMLSEVSEEFPQEVHDPVIYKYNTDEKPVIILLLKSDTMNVEELFDYSENTLKKKLLGIAGIANIDVSGGSIKDYIITLMPEYLKTSDLNYEKLFEAIAKNNINIPIGKLKTGTGSSFIRYPNKFNDPEILEKIYLNDGTTTTLYPEKLIRISYEARKKDKFSLFNNEDSVLIYIYKKNTSNMISLFYELDRELQSIKSVASSYIYNQPAQFLNLLYQIILGLIISIISISLIIPFIYKSGHYFFYTLFSLFLSVILTILSLSFINPVINIMTLAGIALSLGICVDNNIMFIETLSLPVYSVHSFEERIKTGIEKSNTSILGSTLTTIIVFLPLLFLDPEIRDQYMDFALSFSLMLLSSYVLTLFLLPSIIGKNIISGALTQKIKKENDPSRSKKLAGKKRKGKLQLKIFYLAYSKKTFFLLLYLFVSIASVFIFIKEPMGENKILKENKFNIYFEGDPKYNSDYMYSVAKNIGKEISGMGLDDRNFTISANGTKLTLTISEKLQINKNFQSYIHSLFQSGNKKNALSQKKISEYFEKKRRADGFFHFDKEDSQDIDSFTLYFFGDNLKKLNETVDAISEKINNTKMAKQILKGYREGKPEITVKIQPDYTGYFLIGQKDIISYMKYIFYKPVLFKIIENDHLTDVRGSVQLESKVADSLLFNELDIQSAIESTGDEQKNNFTRLGNLAYIKTEYTQSSISKKNSKKYIPLEIYYDKKMKKQFLPVLQSILNNYDFKDDFFYEFDESFEKNRRQNLEIIITILLAIFLEYTVLSMILNNMKIPGKIILTLPALLIGILIYMSLFSVERSFPLNLAILILCGISVNHAILISEKYIPYQNYLKTIKNRLSSPDYRKRAAVIKFRILGSKTRVIGITFLTTLISIIPFLFITNTNTYFFNILSGSSAFGLIFSIFLTPFILLFLL